MTFGVFPYMATYFTHLLLQRFEFLHRNLVAHRDVGAENILINFAEGWLGALVEHGVAEAITPGIPKSKDHL
ncbi:hypothetical protein PILCRDRAFT_9612 [Piloderma croceum F 1598]|uniref:Protein kinase domain-containing protein n=1 Tax=Piloderma croceum (strain F 1598) TaxID=765440 RepID=A0A0C3BSU8_PILCF|nr:hypothetical protein PILCRDRAFT_9612 [Piloderma croceum F 1598]